MKRGRMIDLKTTYFYKKLISIFMACIILAVGIRVVETQEDSFFALSKSEEQGASITSLPQELEPIQYILRQTNESYEEIQENQQQNRKNHIFRYMILLVAILHKNLFSAFKKADVRLWQPDRLAEAVTVFYIHHQDGMKERNPLY